MAGTQTGQDVFRLWSRGFDQGRRSPGLTLVWTAVPQWGRSYRRGRHRCLLEYRYVESLVVRVRQGRKLRLLQMPVAVAFLLHCHDAAVRNFT